MYALVDIMAVSPEFGRTAQPGQQKSITFRQYYTNFLYQHCMFLEQAEAVLDSIDAKEVVEILDKPYEGYPTPVISVITMSVREYTVKWIDANLPGAFYRPVFAS